MEKIHIHPKIVEAMGLNEKEKAVFDVLLGVANIFGEDMSKIAVAAGVNKKSVGRILLDLEKRGVAMKVKRLGEVRWRWKYKKGLEKLINRRSRLERRLKREEFKGTLEDMW